VRLPGRSRHRRRRSPPALGPAPAPAPHPLVRNSPRGPPSTTSSPATPTPTPTAPPSASCSATPPRAPPLRAPARRPLTRAQPAPAILPEDAHPDRRLVCADQARPARARPAHRLRGGALPEHRRLLGRRRLGRGLCGGQPARGDRDDYGARCPRCVRGGAVADAGGGSLWATRARAAAASARSRRPARPRRSTRMSRRTRRRRFAAGTWATSCSRASIVMVLLLFGRPCARAHRAADLADGGSHHFAETISKIKQK
jgi:hypothetical protein